MSRSGPVSRDDWNAHWDLYADSAVENPAQQMRHDIIARLLSQDAGTGDMHVLDLGSGQGDLVKKLEPLLPAAQLAGIELSESGAAISRAKTPRARFVAADLFHPSTALDDFRGWATHAVCSEVLEHVDDPIAFLVQARAYLKPGGRLLVTVPGGPMSAFDRHIGHRQHFDRAKISGILEQAGYRVETTYLAGFPFFNLYRLLVLARGRRLARDVETRSASAGSRIAVAVMKLFRILFYANLRDSPFGWQVVATARKADP